MKCIVAVDRKWGIGYRGHLLVSIPADQKFFRNTTMAKVCIYGRKTLANFPNGLPLAGRDNIVVTTKKDFTIRGARVAHSIEEAIEIARTMTQDDNNIFCIGGGELYKQMLPYIDEALVTKIDYDYVSDTTFPNLDRDEQWELVEESDEQTYFDLPYYFTTYRRVGERK